ncbi:hypothetical protein [Streptomyces tendae]|uniref:hypothetical protein n=1 Tax=Streptomyces tendae TaxID=1932 RepID=UPI0036C438EF
MPVDVPGCHSPTRTALFGALLFSAARAQASCMARPVPQHERTDLPVDVQELDGFLDLQALRPPELREVGMSGEVGEACELVAHDSRFVVLPVAPLPVHEASGSGDQGKCGAVLQRHRSLS